MYILLQVLVGLILLSSLCLVVYAIRVWMKASKQIDDARSYMAAAEKEYQANLNREMEESAYRQKVYDWQEMSIKCGQRKHDNPWDFNQ